MADYFANEGVKWGGLNMWQNFKNLGVEVRALLDYDAMHGKEQNIFNDDRKKG